MQNAKGQEYNIKPEWGNTDKQNKTIKHIIVFMDKQNLYTILNYMNM